MASRHDLRTVQALRGVAALLVVVFHAVNTWSEHVLGRTADQVWPNGSTGVDIFFVISGLVMSISANRSAGRPRAWLTFLRQRIVRIVPLYWITTTAKVAAVLALPALAARTRLDLPYVVGSYLFLPVQDSAGQYFPVLPGGWTLNYEMIFYGLVTIALAVRVPVLAVAGPALVAFALAAIAGDSDGFANTIVIEFLFGVLIGLTMKQLARVPLPIAACLLAIGSGVILTAPVVSSVLRPITWGLPAACCVAGAVALEGRLASALPRWLLDAGDASYSIYLMHPFVVPAVYVLVTRIAPDALWLPLIVAVSLLASAAVGRLGFVALERPLLRRLRPSVARAVA